MLPIPFAQHVAPHLGSLSEPMKRCRRLHLRAPPPARSKHPANVGSVVTPVGSHTARPKSRLDHSGQLRAD